MLPLSKSRKFSSLSILRALKVSDRVRKRERLRERESERKTDRQTD